MTRTTSFPLDELLAGLLLAALAFLWLLALLQLAPEPLAWTFTRLSGVAGYALLAASVALGALMGSRVVPGWLAKPLQYGWHNLLSGFALASIGVHVAYTLVDARYPQTLAAVLLPGRASYAPLALGLGTLATYGMVVVFVSTLRRRHLSVRLWRGLHLLAYPSFALATVHGMWAGSDELLWLYLPALALVALTTALRFRERRTLVS